MPEHVAVGRILGGRPCQQVHQKCNPSGTYESKNLIVNRLLKNWIPSTSYSPSLENALARCAQLDRRPFVDLDGTLFGQGQELDPDSRPEISAWAVDYMRSSRAIIITNRRKAPEKIVGIPVIRAARKPFTALSRFSESTKPICVIGDQYGTDGLLAGRIGAEFIKTKPFGKPRPYRSRMLDHLLFSVFSRSKGTENA